ncbi:MAG: RNA polymerase sigma factor [Gracilimonas sp.]|uniref:RNA polymerase sigma factor n=1 Tax=Gracilimonas sp. TaxID=1974203 RepID=UPI0019847B94|nr:RNA polymerase sigma factor [Gracilimonas sp.]MBD3615641.1 RNA polymerase sigma factor [Gracilimonas sp.]
MDNFEASDKQTVEEVLEGNRKAYSRLVNKHAPMVFHVVRRFIKTEDEVEELAQQIFVKTYERLETFDGKSKFSSWLYVISMNHCRDYVKNVRRKNKNFSEMESHELRDTLGHTVTPDHEMENKETNLILYEGLVSITPDYAEAFLMKYRDGLSYKEISEQLNVTVNALKQRVHRARAELREFMNTKMV